MEWLKTVFDGIGTEIVRIIIGLIIGALGGGAVGYKIGVKNKNKQHQSAKNNANQTQIGNITILHGKDGGKNE